MPRIFFATNARNTPNHPKLMLANIEAIKHLGGSGVAGEIRAFVIKKYKVSDEEQSLEQPREARSRLEYYLGLGRDYLKRSEHLIKSDGNVWILTETGRVIQNIEDTTQSLVIARERIAEEDRARRAARQVPAENDIDDAPPDDEIFLDYAWKSDLFRILQNISPDAFENLCQRLLRESGFSEVTITGKSTAPDGGVDGVGFLCVNLISFKIYFQCKRWSDPVGVKEIRDFRGALDGRANQGLFITSSRFTAPAIEEAKRDGALLIDLIDGDRLCDLLKQYNLGVETSLDGQTITLDPNYFTNLTPNPQQQGN